ncbi:DUF1653 domain-containing protein [Halomonas sp. H5]|uniref:DUF1653 domain-containing protein n=1 Tax=Halomonas sp. H5 TaxID=3423910 RepID=UPI003D36AC88
MGPTAGDVYRKCGERRQETTALCIGKGLSPRLIPASDPRDLPHSLSDGEYGLWVRPLAMFTENVVVDGKAQPHFALEKAFRHG